MFKIYMRDDPISGMCGIINLHPIKGTHWVCFINNFYFDSVMVFIHHKIFLHYIKSKFGKCVYSTYQIQKKDSLCGCILFIHHIP